MNFKKGVNTEMMTDRGEWKGKYVDFFVNLLNKGMFVA